MKTKKAIAFLANPLILYGLLIIGGIVLFLVLSRTVFAGEIPSVSPPVSGCKPKPVNVIMKGDLIVDDDAFIGTRAHAKDIRVNEVRNTNTGEYLNSFPLRGYFGKQNYAWRVDIINIQSGNTESTDRGSNTMTEETLSGKVQENGYSVSFNVPDRNCDGLIDDFDAKIKGTVTTDDNEISTVFKDFTFRNGRFQVK